MENQKTKQLQVIEVRTRQSNSCVTIKPKRRSRKTKRFIRRLKSLAYRTTLTLCIIFGLWVCVSYVEVVAHNLDNPSYEYSNINFFKVITQDLENSLTTNQNEFENNLTESTFLVDVIELTETEVVTTEVTPKYTDEELDMLARVIYGEAGSDWCSHEMQLYVGSVVLNRMNSPYFPDTMEEVIFQTHPLQYACTLESGNYWNTPTQRCYDNARYLLENGSVLPENVIFQAEFTQGDGVYCKEQNMYFCYINK